MPPLLTSLTTLATLDRSVWRTHRYALVEACDRSSLPPGSPLHIIAPAFLGQDTARCPALLDLEAVSAHQRATWLQQAQEQTQARKPPLFRCLLQSQASPRDVAAHLTNRMTLRVSAERTPRQFRYLDPGTFLQLPALLGDVGMAWLFGNLVDTYTLSWAGAWCKVPRPPIALQDWARYQLTSDHWPMLLRLNHVNRVASQLPPPIDVQDWQQRCQTLYAHVQRAEQYGLTREADIMGFTWHALRHHPRFDEHPRVQAALSAWREALSTRSGRDSADDELGYDEAMAHLTLDDWQRISADLEGRPLYQPLNHLTT